jgi:hypothetical protein
MAKKTEQLLLCPWLDVPNLAGISGRQTTQASDQQEEKTQLSIGRLSLVGPHYAVEAQKETWFLVRLPSERLKSNQN